jgi:hypothetical protein
MKQEEDDEVIFVNNEFQIRVAKGIGKTSSSLLVAQVIELFHNEKNNNVIIANPASASISQSQESKELKESKKLEKLARKAQNRNQRSYFLKK